MTESNDASVSSIRTVLIVDDSPIDQRLAGGLVNRAFKANLLFANNGAEALEQVARQKPDVILTDLHMPQLDGLELVQQLREQHPSIPVIIMTARGSEEVAIEALKRGAASYIPKRTLAQHLLRTIEQVLVAADTGRQKEQLVGYMTSIENSFSIPTDPGLIDPLASRLKIHLGEMQLCDGNRKLRVFVALEEALRNAMYHGNLEVRSDLRQDGDGGSFYEAIEKRQTQEPYKSRHVHISARFTREEARFTIRDEGPGFDITQIPDPTDPMNLEMPSGRGLLLIQTFMDEVRFNNKGNEITMIKRPESKRDK